MLSLDNIPNHQDWLTVENIKYFQHISKPFIKYRDRQNTAYPKQHKFTENGLIEIIRNDQDCLDKNRTIEFYYQFSYSQYTREIDIVITDKDMFVSRLAVGSIYLTRDNEVQLGYDEPNLKELYQEKSLEINFVKLSLLNFVDDIQSIVENNLEIFLSKRQLKRKHRAIANRRSRKLKRR